MPGIRVFVDLDRAHVDDAARIWAEATGWRDGDADMAPLHMSRPLIEGVLDLPAGLLVIAVEGDAPAGFAAASAAGHSAGSVAEVHYLGVLPHLGGRGIAKALLEAVASSLRSAGFSEASLKVYVDNRRAVGVYEAAGWRARGPAAAHPRSGRPEQEYRLDL